MLWLLLLLNWTLKLIFICKMNETFFFIYSVKSALLLNQDVAAMSCLTKELGDTVLQKLAYIVVGEINASHLRSLLDFNINQ
jgi:hypothetical protein